MPPLHYPTFVLDSVVTGLNTYILSHFKHFSILEPSLTHSVCFGCILVVMCTPGGMTAVEAVARQGGVFVKDHAMRFIQSFWQTSAAWTLTRMFPDRGERTMKDAWNVKMKIKNMCIYYEVLRAS